MRKNYSIERRLALNAETMDYYWPYQTSGITISHDVVGEDGQVSVVLQNFIQRFEHSLIIDWSL